MREDAVEPAPVRVLVVDDHDLVAERPLRALHAPGPDVAGCADSLASIATVPTGLSCGFVRAASGGDPWP